MPIEAYVERVTTIGIRRDFQAVLLLRGSQGLQAATIGRPTPLSGIASQVEGCKQSPRMRDTSGSGEALRIHNA